ncbi:MAG: 3-phosphoshikimate 1-carboxyvinyltransferase [Actinobacteria bacterium]|nr:3-phosphoshikimate 1-carboxyvinyltransferase [Actinomycetota bacterium]
MNDALMGGLFPPARAGLRGSVRPPGDKSVSHRAVLMGSVNDGPVIVTGFLRSTDTMATVAAVRALGVQVDDHGDRLLVHGAGWEGLQEPDDVIDVGNSGTLLRLLPGLLAPRDFLCVLTGDASIRRRPMGRVLEPLAAMGVEVAGRCGDSLPPVVVRGGALRGIEYRMPVASAQVKSAILLAGLRAEGQTSVVEPAASRDHTERMIRYGGGRAERDGPVDGPGVVKVWPLERLKMDGLTVPGDFSSAAFFLVAALLIPGSDISVENVGLNPTRTGLLAVIERMGGQITVEREDVCGPEPVGTVTARWSELEATDVDADEVPGLIDELPLFLLAAARADGISRLRGAAELRAKESDRLEAMATLLRTLDIRVTEYPDGMDVEGDPQGWAGGEVETRADHRLAMVGAVAGAASRHGVRVDDLRSLNVSYPGFVEALVGLGGEMAAPGSGSRGVGR